MFMNVIFPSSKCVVAIAAVLAALAPGARAAATVYSDLNDFLQAIEPGYFLETFDAYPSIYDSPIAFSNGTYGVSAVASGGFWNVNDVEVGTGYSLSTYSVNKPITLNITTGNVSAIGGYFYNWYGPTAAAGTFRISLSDGTNYEVVNPDASSFVGFTSLSGIAWMRISSIGATGYPTVNNLYVGQTASPEAPVVTFNPSSNSWTTPGNWTGGLPSPSSVARIGSTAGNQTVIFSNTTASVHAVEFSGGGGAKLLSLTGASSLTVGDGGIYTVRDNGVTSTLQIASGSSAVNATTVDIDTLRLQASGTLAISEGQSWRVLGMTLTGTSGGNSSLILNGGSLTTGTLSVANGAAGFFTMNSGELAADVIQRGATPGTPAFLWNSGTIRSSDAASTAIRGVNSSSTLLIQVADSGDHVFDVGAGKTMVVEDTAVLRDRTISGAITKSGDGLLRLSGSNSYTGGTLIRGGVLAVEHERALGPSGEIAFGGGTLQYSAGNTVDYSGRFSTASAQDYRIDTNGQDVAYASALASEGGTLRKSGDGMLTLEAASTYSGGTEIDGGTLRVANSEGSATGSGTVAVNANGTLSGGGSVAGDLLVRGAISPGDGIGTLSSGNQIWKSGGSYIFEIGSVAGGAGSAWDFLAVDGTLGIDAASASPFVVSVNSIGSLADFSASETYSWTILSTTAGIEGFSKTRLAVDASGFLDETSGAFSLSLGNDGKDLVLNYNLPLVPAALEIVGGNNQRAVRGSSVGLSYALLETSGTAQNYSVAGANLSGISDLANGSNPNPVIIGNGANVITGVVDTSAAEAGEVVEATLSVFSEAPGTDSVSKSTSIAVVDNRELSLNGTGNLGKVDRVVQGAAIAGIWLSTGSQNDDLATRITVNGGLYETPAVSFTAAGQLFDSAYESQYIILRAGYGVGTQLINLNLADPSLVGTSLVALLAAEDIEGASLDGLTDLTVTGTATIIVNRDLSGSVLNLGRVMAGVGTENVSGFSKMTVSGGYASDDQATRVFLNESGPVSENGVTVSVNETVLFDSYAESTDVDMHYDVGFSRSVGTKYAQVNLAGLLTSGESPALDGVDLDDSVLVGIQKSYLQDRELSGEQNVVVRALAGTTVDTITNRLTSYGSDGSNTRITVNGVLLDGENEVMVLDEVLVNAFSSVSTGEPAMQTKTLSEGNGIVGEGLDGENVTSFSWDYGVRFYEAASAAVSATVSGSASEVLASGSTGLVLGVGDAIRIDAAAKSDAGNGLRANTDLVTGIVGNDGFSLSGLDATLMAGTFGIGTIAFNEAGKLNGMHSARLTLTLSNDLDLRGAVLGDLGAYSFTVSHMVTGASGNGGSAYVASGSRLRDSGLASSFSNSVLAHKTSASFLDSEMLASNVSIQIAFNSIEDATGAGALDLISDTMSIEGLDGIQFVLEISYDAQTLINKFGTEEVAVLTWLDTSDNTWKNAIEGNSRYGDLDFSNPFGRRYRMSYDSYLAVVGGTPVLNDYGYDPANDVMWAVLDHNSEFGGSGIEGAPEAIPEPSTWVLVLLAGAAIAFRRTRSVPLAIEAEKYPRSPLA